MPCRTNAFTLIELLVVIAIIAILAAILFPVFSQAIGTAILLYAQDADVTFIPAGKNIPCPQDLFDAGACTTPGTPTTPPSQYTTVSGFYLSQPYSRNNKYTVCPNIPTNVDGHVKAVPFANLYPMPESRCVKTACSNTAITKASNPVLWEAWGY